MKSGLLYRVGAATIIALPFIFLLAAMATWNVTVPFSDDLFMVEPLHRIHVSGDFRLSDFIYQLNEHIAILPFLLVNAPILFWKWDSSLLLLVNPALAALNVYLWYYISRQTLPQLRETERLLLAFTVATFATSYLQWEIWSHTSTINLTLPITAALLINAICLSAQSTIKKIILVTFSCALASISSSIGLLTWLAVLPHLPRLIPRRLPLAVASWLGLFVIVSATLTLAHSPQDQHLQRSQQGQSPAFYGAFAAIAAGAAILPLNPPVTGTLGTVIIITILYSFWCHKRDQVLLSSQSLPYLSLTIFFFGVLAALAWGRGSWGIYGRALQSRYVALTYPLVILMIHLLYQRFWSQSSARPALRAGVAFLLVCNIASSGAVVPRWQRRHTDLSVARQCLRQAAGASADCLAKLGNSAISGEDVRQLAPLLRDLGAY